jgi:hypothetical protein
MADSNANDIRKFLTIARMESPEAIFAALDDLAQSLVGVRLFSCSIFNRAKLQARRVYTNNPDVYPLSGLKVIVPNRWTETVLDRREVFVANTIEEIAEVFPDHQTIARLGLGSVINLPVQLSGAFLGTVNMLDRPGAYDPGRIEAAQNLHLPAIAAFASLRLAEGKT